MNVKKYRKFNSKLIMNRSTDKLSKERKKILKKIYKKYKKCKYKK